MVKDLLREMTRKDNSNSDALVERSKTINDLQAMNELFNDPDLRAQAQAVLEVMYRMPHTKRRTVKDMLAVAKLLMGYTSDMANEIVARSRELMGAPNGNSDIDSSATGNQPPNQLEFTAPPAVGEGTEAAEAPASGQPDAPVLPASEREN